MIMFQNISETYTRADASMEILLMLFGSFVLGFIFAWILKSTKVEVIYEEVPAATYTASKKSASKTIQPSAPSATIAVQWTSEIQDDDLQIIEGIWPKIEALLQKHNVVTYRDMIDQWVTGLENILEQWGKRFQSHSPATWPDQAKLADQGKWRELEEYQEILQWGKKNT